MKEQEIKKKNWIKPEVVTLKIKKDTFAGSTGGAESGPNVGSAAHKTK